MLPQQINAWLSASDDYEAGLQMLRETGYSGFTLTILSKGADTYNRNRLESELRKWVANPTIVSPPGPVQAPGPEDNSAPVPSTPEKVLPPVQPVATAPAGVQGLKARTYRLLDERGELKAQIRATMDSETDAAQEARRERAFRIKAITRELDALYSHVSFFDEHGYLPPTAVDPAIESDDRAALLNARTYVSRYKAKLKKKGLTPAQKEKYTQLLTQYEAEKNRLEAKLITV